MTQASVKPKLQRFIDAERWFACPLCSEVLQFDASNGHALVCSNHHCFDLAKQGYANLEPHAKTSEVYSRANFEQRGRILEAGYYAHVLNAVARALQKTGHTAGAVLDAGCGEGYYARAIAQQFSDADVLAFDLSKQSVQLAAREDADCAVRWFVGNLMNLPIQNERISTLLNVFSPANYSEFNRVLEPDAVVVKVVPGSQHVHELRELAAGKGLVRQRDYSNEQVVDAFAEHYSIVSRETVSQTFAMPADDVLAFAQMTPLLFHVDLDELDLTQVHEVTVEAEVLVGRN
ncbi:rRNA (guanine-N1)-methyltransferase [Bifidobacterium dolichotidis]|uniref:rRNA (Guanine-N1)-methyltransferase n=1 Tax=Bifidobacterium dolichotidis TaxID=2306976 RepID=A0A430FQW8_9BIFI|nr:methyltransferase domain-containing protein [Bifidobacterium dolichotidis]RSX55221.1 rRNA (guanine-N1)-methyltransferase [Bifidobacterium dolichotidis]